MFGYLSFYPQARKSFSETTCFIIMIYLVQIAFLTSLCKSFYFFMTFQFSPEIQLIGYLAFGICVLFSLVSRRFRQWYLNLCFNHVTLKYVINVQEFVHKLTKTNPFLFFLLFHGALSFSLLHFLMIYLNQIEFLPELFYQIFNVFRLLAFPIAIFLFAFFAFPSHFRVIEAALEKPFAESLRKIATMAAESLIEAGNPQKNPKTAMALYGTVITTGGAVGYKHAVTDQLEKTAADIGFTPQQIPKNIPDEESIELHYQAIRLFAEVRQPALTLAGQDIYRVFTGQATTSDKIVDILPALNKKQVQDFAARKKAEETANSLAGSPMAGPLQQKTPSLEEGNAVVPKISSVLETMFVF